MASESDGAILVVRHGKTTRDQVLVALSRLDSVAAHLIGTVANMTPGRRISYGYSYSYGYAPQVGRSKKPNKKVKKDKKRQGKPLTQTPAVAPADKVRRVARPTRQLWDDGNARSGRSC